METRDINKAVKLAKTDKENSPYTDQVHLKTSESMDKATFGSAQVEKTKINSGKEKYNALTNNCADVVVNVVEKGTGVSLKTGLSPKPNDKFKALKENKDQIQKNVNKKAGS